MGSIKTMKASVALFAAISVLVACEMDEKKDGGEKKSYSFTTTSKVEIKSSSFGLTNNLHTSASNPYALTTAAPPMCKDNVCFTPTQLTGKYYGVGLMIQSNNSGMMAYFGQDSWSGITSASKSYNFDFQNPISESGNLVCCTSEGDLANGNSYFSDAVYMFGYFDVTFEIPSSSGANGDAIGTHTIRFVLADDAVDQAKRGDLLYSDAGTFKWMDSEGVLSTTRPTAPITMDAGVVNWSNPYGDKGNQSIPVINSMLEEATGGGVNIVTEDELKIQGRTYSFDFQADGFIAFPTLLRNDIGMLDSRKKLMSLVHIQGLPHSKYNMGSSATSKLTISGP
jgi:hypothetical protein